MAGNQNHGPPPPPPGHLGPAPGRAPGGQPVMTAQQQHELMQQRQLQMQQQMQQQQQRAIMHQANILAAANQNRSVRTVDLRDDMPITREKACEKLAKYFVFRFEPANDESDVEDEDEPLDPKKKSSKWIRVQRTEVLGLKQVAIAGEVKKLNKETYPLNDKKNTLNSHQQRQVERALEELRQRNDDHMFETNLVQLDQQVRLRTEKKEKRHQGYSNKQKHHHAGVVLFKVKKSDWMTSNKRNVIHGKHKDGKAHKTPERISITAYFKCAPKPEVDAIGLYFQIQAQREIRQKVAMQPAPQPEFFHPRQEQPAAEVVHPHETGKSLQTEGFVRVVQGGKGKGEGKEQGRGSRSREGPRNGRGGSSNRRHPSRNRSQSRSRSRGSRSRSRSHGRPGDSSPETKYSATFSPSEDGSSTASYPSQSSSDFERGRAGRPRRPSGGGGFHGAEPGHFGIRAGHVPQHRLRRYSQHRIDDFPSGPPLETVPVELVEEMKVNWYAAGRADAEAELRKKNIAVARASPLRRRDRVLPARVIQDRAPLILEGQLRGLRIADESLSDDWEDEYDPREPVYLVPSSRRGPTYRGGDVGSGGGVGYVQKRDVENELDERRRAEDQAYVTVLDETREAREREARELPLRREQQRRNMAAMRNRRGSVERRSRDEEGLDDEESDLSYGNSRNPFTPLAQKRSRSFVRRGTVSFE